MIASGRLTGQQVAVLLQTLVSRTQAVYDPPNQNSNVILYWRKPEEWAEVLHRWVRKPAADGLFLKLTGDQAVSTGQLNTILTFYEIQEPEIVSELNGIPTTLLRKAIGILAKTNRAQLIESAEGGGVRFFM